jgi:hypothetical protein
MSVVKSITTVPPGGRLPEKKINRRRACVFGRNKRQDRLNARISDFTRMKSGGGLHKPGSLKK